MKHDTDWLKESNPYHPESGVNEAHDFVEFATDYHEHMAAPLLAEIERLTNVIENQAALIGQTMCVGTTWTDVRAKQERLPAEFETILYDNVEELYEKD